VSGDLGPHNTVFRGRRPVAIIDWDDDVGPGSRAVDFADAVWGFAEVTSESVPVAEQARRVAVMCATYPAMTPGIVVEELRAQFERARSNHFVAARSGPLQVFEGLIAWMDRHGPTIAAARGGIRLRASPRGTNGKAERFIQTLLREWAYGQSYPSSSARMRQLPRWLHHYNHTRLHGSLGHKPPISVLAA